MKKEKGITLVALIITIIVLLILAVVTISAVNEGSLFAHSNNAAAAYSAAQEKENTMIFNYLAELDKHNNQDKNSSTEKQLLQVLYAIEQNDLNNDSVDSITHLKLLIYNDGTIEVYSYQFLKSDNSFYTGEELTFNCNILTESQEIVLRRF